MPLGRPRFRSVPARSTSAGQEAVELAAAAGLVLDPWQAQVLEDALGERADGKWSAFEVSLVVPRQNGKGSILEARELAGLFLFGENLILHSAHEFKTASEAFRRIWQLVQQTPDLEKRVKRVRTSHGDEGIELLSGQRLRFVARSTGSGRGFSGDVVILDEAYKLGPEAMAALLPTLSARPNPQIWYTSSAPLVDSVVLRSLCKRGRAGESPALAYFEWCADDSAGGDDRSAWAQANPALGIRIDEEFVANEREALENLEFLRERLGIWFDDDHVSVIPEEKWLACEDPASQVADVIAFAVDVSPDRTQASIGLAGRRADGLDHIEHVDGNAFGRKGTRWIVPRLLELVERWKPVAVAVDPGSAAGSLLPELDKRLDLEVTLISAREHGQACGAFYDAVIADEPTVRHIGQASLNAAVFGAKTRNLADAWAWDRRNASVDITPLVAVTLAKRAYDAAPKPDPEPQVWAVYD